MLEHWCQSSRHIVVSLFMQIYVYIAGRCEGWNGTTAGCNAIWADCGWSICSHFFALWRLTGSQLARIWGFGFWQYSTGIWGDWHFWMTVLDNAFLCSLFPMKHPAVTLSVPPFRHRLPPLEALDLDRLRLPLARPNQLLGPHLLPPGCSGLQLLHHHSAARPRLQVSRVRLWCCMHDW